VRQLGVFLLCLLALAAYANADVFGFSYTGTESSAGWGNTPPPYSTIYGTLTATDNGDGSWTVTGGSGFYTFPDPDYANNFVSLAITLIPPETNNPPLFTWDNVICPEENSTVCGIGNLLDENGLGFSIAGTTHYYTNPAELNIYLEPDLGPGIYEAANNSVLNWEGDDGTFSITPEPWSISLFITVLAGIAARGALKKA